MISTYFLAGLGSLAAIAFLLLLVGISRARARAAEIAATMERHRRAVAETIIDQDMKRRADLERVKADHERAKAAYDLSIKDGARDHLSGDW